MAVTDVGEDDDAAAIAAAEFFCLLLLPLLRRRFHIDDFLVEEVVIVGEASACCSAFGAILLFTNVLEMIMMGLLLSRLLLCDLLDSIGQLCVMRCYYDVLPYFYYCSNVVNKLDSQQTPTLLNNATISTMVQIQKRF